jgi:hypothetical protein
MNAPGFATAEGLLRTSEASSVRLNYPQLASIAFLDHVGQTLRDATSEILRQPLPEDIQRLLRQLKGVEVSKKAPK